MIENPLLGLELRLRCQQLVKKQLLYCHCWEPFKITGIREFANAPAIEYM
jgi:hypothetical protein